MTPPLTMHAAIVSRLKIMANLDISERRLPQDGRIRAMVHGRHVDLRVSTLPTHARREDASSASWTTAPSWSAWRTWASADDSW